MALDMLPGLDSPQALSVGPTTLGLCSLNLPDSEPYRAVLSQSSWLWAEPSSAFGLGPSPARSPGCSDLLSTAGACARATSPGRTSCSHKTQIFALFFFRLRWKFSLWTFDIAQNTLNPKYRNISMSLRHFLPALGTQLLEGSVVPLCKVFLAASQLPFTFAITQ